MEFTMNKNRQKRLLRTLDRKEREALDIDITSLLDILVILLVFLLKSYNASDLKIDLARQVVLPDSRSSKLGHQSVIVQINKNKKIFINSKKIGSLNTNTKKIPILYQELVNQKKLLEMEIVNFTIRENLSDEQILTRKKAKAKKINLVLDKSLPYSVLSQVMYTSALAGFPEFKFIVQGKYE
jgi:biopolymer transport protein ExbD